MRSCHSKGNLWHHAGMKALKSKRATELLADPDARDQLRLYLMNKHPAANSEHTGNERFVVRRSNGVQFEVKLVPKATVTS
jgi:hypothetical protein